MQQMEVLSLALHAAFDACFPLICPNRKTLGYVVKKTGITSSLP